MAAIFFPLPGRAGVKVTNLNSARKNKYSDEIVDLIERACPELASVCNLGFKNSFGAVAGYVDGNIFVACGRFGVALKLPPDTPDELFAMNDVERLRYFPKGHIKKEYAVLPERILKDEKQFKRLVDESIGYVTKLA